MLGLQFAIAKTVAAIGVGLLGGFGVLVAQRMGVLVGEPLREGIGNGGCAGSKIRNRRTLCGAIGMSPHQCRVTARRRLDGQGYGARSGHVLVGGGVTSIPAALAVWAIARRAVFAVYLALATVGAMLSGIVFQIVAG